MSRTYKDVPYWVKLKRSTSPDIAKNIKNNLESDFRVPIETTEINQHLSYVKGHLPYSISWRNNHKILNIKENLLKEKVKYNQHNTKLHTKSFFDVNIKNVNDKDRLNEISFVLDNYRDRVVDILNDFIEWNEDNIKGYSFSLTENKDSSKDNHVELTDINFKGFYLSPRLYGRSTISFLFDNNFIINFVTSIVDNYTELSFESFLILDVEVYYVPSMIRDSDNKYFFDYTAYDYELSREAYKNAKFNSKYNLHNKCKCSWCESNEKDDFKDFPYSAKKTQANIELNKLRNAFNHGGLDELKEEFDDF